MVDREHFDVLVVGAGLSGIGAGCHLQTSCPDKTYAILEARERLGGTWDLFRYPGIRSDSDMFTLGYSFRPWRGAKAIADGPSILEYVRETAEERGIDRKIRYGHRVDRASWSTADARWTVEVTHLPSGRALRFTARFLFVCAGYYRYDEGYTPAFEGVERFAGRVIHPQHWTDDVDYAGKRVVVIGSGATAVTLVPAMAKTAAHVTMLQRSPTYVLSIPERDKIADALRERLPAKPAHQAIRWKNVGIAIAFHQFCRRQPERARKFLLAQVRKELGSSTAVERHFTPSYAPWDQRLCFVPDGDLFEAIRSGRASVVTDRIETFTERGIRLRSGEELEADLVVTATGLNLQFLGGAEIEVDGRRVEPSETMAYKGMMCSDVPNLALAIGYTNASWTLKCDLTCEYVCRLLNYMDEHGYAWCCPRRTDPSVTESPLLDLASGYVQRSIDRFPKQGSVPPWRVYQNYALDLLALRRGRVDDGTMQFAGAGAKRSA